MVALCPSIFPISPNFWSPPSLAALSSRSISREVSPDKGCLSSSLSCIQEAILIMALLGSVVTRLVSSLSSTEESRSLSSFGSTTSLPGRLVQRVNVPVEALGHRDWGVGTGREA